MDETVTHVPRSRRWAQSLIGITVVLAAGGAAFAVLASREGTGSAAKGPGPVVTPSPISPPESTVSSAPSLSPTATPTRTPATTTTRPAPPRTGPPPQPGGGGSDHVADIQLHLTTDQYVGERIGQRTVRARVDVRNASRSHRSTVVIRWREDGKEVGRQTRVLTGSGRFNVTFQHEYQNCGKQQTAYVTVDGSHREAVTIAEGIELMGWICNG